MERCALEELKKWKASSARKPLIIRGARQDGKTWLMRELGKECYKRTVYINFEGNSVMARLFSEDLDVRRIL